ncbi:hypothetical protein EVAR_74253_1 [Eumeta japonica]|uniref:Uncharacterized protein n=1 Tax=Eumeta variegata TaxID=151549 RepID=A0A4C1SFB5_EUMVA|nr:hypothetical protein EVAR_74253_1 [Eumeta japonica]
MVSDFGNLSDKHGGAGSLTPFNQRTAGTMEQVEAIRLRTRCGFIANIAVQGSTRTGLGPKSRQAAVSELSVKSRLESKGGKRLR